jgi:CHAT domain-containing protein
LRRTGDGPSRKGLGSMSICLSTACILSWQFAFAESSDSRRTPSAQVIEVVLRGQSADCVVQVTSVSDLHKFDLRAPEAGSLPARFAIATTDPHQIEVKVRPVRIARKAGVCIAPVIERVSAGLDYQSAALRESFAARTYAGARHDQPAAFKQAASEYSAAAQQWQRIGERRRAAVALLAASSIRLRSLQQRSEALPLARQAYELLDAGSENSLRAVAARLVATCVMGLDDQRDATGARYSADQWFKRAFEYALRDRNPFETANTLNEFALARYGSGNYEAARHWFEQAQQVSRRHQYVLGVALASLNLAYLRGDLGEYGRAVEDFDVALAQFDSRTDPGFYANLLDNSGRFLRSQGRFDAALARHQQALALHRQRGIAADIATSEYGIGSALAALDEFEAADNHLSAALRLKGIDQDPQTKRALHRAHGNVLLALGDTNGARDAFARAWIGSTSPSTRIAQALASARLARASGDAAEALRALDAVRDVRTAVPVSDGVALAIERSRALRATGKASQAELEIAAVWRRLNVEVGSTADIAATTEHAAALVDAGSLSAASRRAADAINMIEKGRRQIASAQIRAQYSATLRSPFEIQIAALRRLAAPDVALTTLLTADRARGALLRELRSRGAPTVPGTNRLQALDEKINRIEELLRADNLDRALLTILEADVRKLRVQIAIDDRSAATVKDDRLITLNELQDARSRLASDEALVLAMVGSTQSFVWTIRRDDIYWRELPPAGALAALVRQAHDFAAKALPQSREGDANRMLGDYLLRDALRNGPIRRVVFCLDGSLHQLPVAALIVPTTSSANNRLAGIAEIATLDSLASLTVKATADNTRAARTNQQRSILLVHSIAIARDDVSAVGQIEARQIRSLFAASPIEELAGNVPSAKLLAALNTPRRWVHVAAHGEANAVVPALSYLQLSPDATIKGPQNGSKIYAGDIRNMVVNAELVVLSACETRFGRTLPGEGLQGMSYAFLAAGANNVIGSLWKVSDGATSELMSEFYARLFAGKNAAEALQLAQASIMRRRPHPYFWSGFVLSVAGRY